MIKELLNGHIRVGIAKIEMHDLPQSASDDTAELQISDSMQWFVANDFLRVECCRQLKFEPTCNFEITATYFVEHFLTESGTLNTLSAEEIRAEILADPSFYIQENQGYMARLSLIISQLTASFGGPPLVSIPLLHESDEPQK
jgi:hypothetical protein